MMNFSLRITPSTLNKKNNVEHTISQPQPSPQHCILSQVNDVPTEGKHTAH